MDYGDCKVIHAGKGDVIKEGETMMDRLGPTGPSGHLGPAGVDGKESKTDCSLPTNTHSTPNQYPYAVNSVKYLRPLQQPLFDTEFFVPNKSIKSIPFFVNSVNNPFHHDSVRKRDNDTNLYQARMLDYPLEFSILGFNVIIDPKATQADRDNLLSNGAHFRFFFSGRRPYCSVPMENVCAKRSGGESLTHAMAKRALVAQNDILKFDSSTGRYSEDRSQPQTNDAAEDQRSKIEKAAELLEKCVYDKSYYKFNLGKSALKIKPGEKFGVELSWTKSPFVSRPIRIIVELIGLLWTPL